MPDFADRILQAQKDVESEREWQIFKARTTQDKSRSVFSWMKAAAESTVAKLKDGHREYSLLSYADDGASFTVRNLTYPAAKITVSRSMGCILFETEIKADPTAVTSRTDAHLDANLDEHWNLLLSYRGKVLTPEDALEMMLAPAIKRV